MKANRVTELFGIEYPIIAGGMVWISSWRLAAAVSNAGGLGLLGAGSLTPDLLREHIQKMKAATQKPWGVNLPMMNPKADELVDVIIEEGVKIVFTSAGSPKKYTHRFHEAGIKVAHVVASWARLKPVWMPSWPRVSRPVAITVRRKPRRWCSFPRPARPRHCL